MTTMRDAVTVEKGARQFLRQQDRRVKGASNRLAKQIERVMLRYARIKADEAIKELGGMFTKVSAEEKLQQELLDIFQTFGVAQTDSAGRRIVGDDWIMRPDLLDRVLRDKQIKVVLLVEETRNQIRESLRQILQDAQGAFPPPTRQEVARRIARQWYGPAQQIPGDLKPISAGTAEEERVTAPGGGQPGREERIDRWTRNDGREYLFSFERAQTIARTELAQTENAGIAEGYSQIGIERVRWRAFPNDGRSGDRRHWQMNTPGEGRIIEISVADMTGSDPNRWFMLPDGTRQPHPSYAGGLAKHNINCRCTIVPA